MYKAHIVCPLIFQASTDFNGRPRWFQVGLGGGDVAEGIHLAGSFQGWDPAATATQWQVGSRALKGLKNSPPINGKKNDLKIMSKLIQLNRGELFTIQTVQTYALKNVEFMLQLRS